MIVRTKIELFFLQLKEMIRSPGPSLQKGEIVICLIKEPFKTSHGWWCNIYLTSEGITFRETWKHESDTIDMEEFK